ncbi:sigma-70 family RNA polymerase sigma factor [Opitutus sp. ER46]|uniref:RNA polymerase sigma factor n=1 Tax=Opitutus sp. ER46 TaxID=2161864 RepID=UPI001304D8EE|nr:sigma-70 family RNA polymerase sigma factor [Opitutus sp. ER46]
MSPTDLADLTTQTEHRRAQWFAQEIQAHDGQLKAYLRSAYPSVRDVDDVVQESYLRIWQRHATKPITSAKNFLFSVARHLAVDLLRRKQISPITAVTDLAALNVMDESAATVETTCTREEVALLLQAIDQLPHRCREIMILRKLQGVPQREIAQRLGLSEQTVQVQIGRGTRRCEEFLRARGVFSERES